MAKKDDKKMLETARERWKRCVDADQTNRRLAIDDLKFLHEPGAQWDDVTRKERGERPCYEFNKTRISAKRIINAIRSNRPQGKVRAVEDGDKADSDVAEGLIRNIWNVSEGDAAIDNAAEYQVGGGMGAWKISTKYSTDDAWDQDLVVESIRNPFSLWADPNARDPMKRDAEFWFLESGMSRDAYESKYGKVPAVEWESSEFDDDDGWEDDDRVRICEYWYKKPVAKTLLLLSDGSTVDAAELKPEAMGDRQVMRQRVVQTNKICMAIIAGDKVLEGPVDWVGSKFPFVMVYGEHIVIDGKTKWWGLCRHAKDAQRLHNAMLTNAVETAALAPQAKWWATPAQAQGLLDQWSRAHKENLPYLPYNVDPQAPGHPPQMPGSQIPAAFVQLAMVTSEELKGTIGIFDPSLGDKTNATSGVAKRSEINQGEIATYNYQDNIARGVRYTWELLLDCAPKIYDTARTIRVIGTDGAEDYVRINQISEDGQTIHDLSKAKYDVTITVGPSFSTQRQEAAEIYTNLSQANPMVMGVAGDLIFKSLDLPYAQDMAERMQAMLPPQIQQMLQQKSQTGGKKMPPEVMAAMAQVDQAMQQVQMHGQLVQEAAQEVEQSKTEAEGEKAAADKAKSDVQLAIANLKVQEAHLETKVAQFEKMVIEAQTQLAGEQQDGADKAEAEKADLTGDVVKALEQIDTQSQAFIQAAGQILQHMAEQQAQAAAAPKRPNKTVQIKRVNGKLQGIVMDADTGEALRNVEVSRVNGEMIGNVKDLQ